jgi:hypothetical protein
VSITPPATGFAEADGISERLRPASVDWIGEGDGLEERALEDIGAIRIFRFCVITFSEKLDLC